MSETKLRSCPLCGDRAYIRHRNGFRNPYSASCALCGCEGPQTLLAQQASETWNTRPLEDELLEALRPFAALAEEVNELRHEDDSTCPWRLKAGDIRKALTAIAHAEGRQ